MNWMDGGCNWMGLGMGWPMLLFWISIILVLGLALKGVFQNVSQQPEPGKSIQQILDERYAKGEIDKEEYMQKKRDLMEK